MSSAAAILAELSCRGIRLGLESSRRVLAELGGPQDRFAVVLVAGTNGKGSTAALLASMCRAAGLATGLFTSPGLECAEEQIQVDGRAIAAADLAALLREVLAAADRLALPLTAFEALTAAALLEFAHRAVELAVLEAGMGGARDSTNVTEPIVSLVTTVGLDHAQLLGSDREKIAVEKAGILRPGRPAVIGWLDATAHRAVEEVARRIGARTIDARHRVSLRTEDRGAAGQLVKLDTGKRSYDLRLPLAGSHQARNLSLAVLAAEELAEQGWDQLDAEAIARGAAGCRWPGRLEWIRHPGSRPILLDAAHNQAGAEALACYLGKLDEPFDLLFGVLRDKDPGPLLHRLGQRARRIVLTAPRDERAWDPHRSAVPATASSRIEIRPCLTAALTEELSLNEPLLVVCGSLRLVGQARTLLRHRGLVHQPE